MFNKYTLRLRLAVCQWVAMIPYRQAHCTVRQIPAPAMILCKRAHCTLRQVPVPAMILCKQAHCTVNGQYEFRTVIFLFFEFSYCLYKPHITTFCIFFATFRYIFKVALSLWKVLHDTRKAKMKCGIHFSRPCPPLAKVHSTYSQTSALYTGGWLVSGFT